MVVYNISVSNRKISLISQTEEVAVGGNKGYEVRFTFDGEWEGKDKVASFFFGGSHYLVEFNGDYCEVPPIFNSNSFRIGVYVGEKTDETNYMSTDTIEIPCKISVRDYISGSRPNGEFGKNYTYEAKGYAEDAKEYADKAEGVLFSANGIESRVSKNEKIIQNIVDGIAPSHFYVDDSVAYSKDVPSNALPYAEINKVGGNVTAIKSSGANLFNIADLHESAVIVGNSFTPAVYAFNQDFFTNTVGASTPIPMEYIDKLIYLEAGNYTFSWESNAIDSRVTICTVSPNDGSVISQFFDNESGYVLTLTEAALITLRRGTNVETTYTNFQINRGNTVLPYVTYKGEVDSFPVPPEVQSLDGYGQSNPDNATEYNYVDFNNRRFVAYGHIVDGVWERHDNAPVVTDISEILSADNFIEVEGGGTIIAENENKKPVPTEITYMLEVTA